MKEKQNKDIEEVMKKETRRGRRPIDLEARRERVERLRDMQKLLEVATEEEFRKAMRAAGLRDGDPRFLAALQIWRNYRS